MKVLEVYRVSSKEFKVESKFLLFWRQRNIVIQNDDGEYVFDGSSKVVPEEVSTAIFNKFIRTTIPWGDKSTIIKEKTVKVRKDHECHGCTNIIHKGEVALTVSCVEDKKLIKAYLCTECVEFLNDAKPEVFADGIQAGIIGDFKDGKGYL